MPIWIGGCLTDGKGGGADTEALTLTGRMLSVNGTGQSGVLVKLIPSSYDPSEPKPERIRMAFTDASGNFVFENLPKDSLYNLIGAGAQDQFGFFDSLKAGANNQAYQLSHGRILKVSILSNGGNDSGTSVIYFPGTDIIRAIADSGSTLDSIPVGLDNLALMSGREKWYYASNSAGGGGVPQDSLLGKTDTLRIETAVSQIILTPSLKWRNLGSQPFPPSNGPPIPDSPTPLFHLSVGKGSEIYATSQTNLYKSSDGGETWTSILDISADPYVTLATDTGGRVLVNRHLSLNQGGSWSDFDRCDANCTSPIAPTASLFGANGLLFVAGSFPDSVMEIIRTEDFGKTSLEVPIEKGIRTTPVAFTSNDQGQFFLGLIRTGIITSNDNGKTWFAQGTLPDYNPFLANGKADLTCLQTSKNGTLYAGYANLPGDTTSPALFRISSDLTSAEAVAGGFHKSGVTCMVRGPAGALFVGTSSNGVWRSFDGKTWTGFNENLLSQHILALTIDAKGTLFAMTNAGIQALDNAEGTTLPGR